MNTTALKHDPYNLIITGVGGQGNVLASRMVGDMLSRLGFDITIGETFGASQRGGSVMSHLRISRQGSYSPQIPLGRAHMIVSLEPSEALRMLRAYGNPEVQVITNMRPVRSSSVISGEQPYPAPETIVGWINDFSEKAWFLDTTETATRLGNPIFGNVMLVGALARTGQLPLDRDIFEAVVRSRMPEAKVRVNLEAFDAGGEMIGEKST
ncbi:Indolepyruvate ferredoxin oxidoreductase, beta subunit [Desulfosarcina cetonica]|uniref:indolepyruvate oxidoreductase subunit beta n=1 Tax=Desulfosarcina cetonica TaxID=90730 RepID=UPI0006D2752B|nr:indolepyruvate oxidoreductase subunit beta [Desulfosarcina cetonica]VTR69070.1 Indolepyruvate ferredoxin oxidoreductase, beta subunit [Desulfosarcina cetonica]